MKRIGIVGTGIMGHGMAVNFLKGGATVQAWNRSADKLQDLAQLGATIARSPKAVATASDIVFEVVSNDEASRYVWYGDDGILAGASPQAVLIASSTLSLPYVDELIAACQASGNPFLDMPLTGSRFGAENGKLRLLTGGEAATLDSIRPELALIADKIYHFGSAGSGMRFKLILNMLLGVQVNAAAQAKQLAAQVGLNPDDVHHAIFDAPMGAASHATDMGFKGVPTPDTVNFSVQWVEKDLRYAQAMAKQYGVSVDLLDATQADFAKAIQAGLGPQDWTAIATIFTGTRHDS